MSDEFRNDIEEVEAEVVEDGKVPFTMDDAPVAPEAPKPNFTQAESMGSVPDNDQPGRVYAIISLICGIVSVVCCCACWLPIVCGVAAVVFGIISLNKQPHGNTMAVVGIVCGSVGALIGLVMVVIGGILGAGSESVNNDVLDALKDLGNL